MKATWWIFACILVPSGLAAALVSRADGATLSVFLAVVLIGAIAAVILWLLMMEPEMQQTSQRTRGRFPQGFGQALLNQMPIPVMVINARGQVSYFNEAAQGALARVSIGSHYSTFIRAPQFVDGVDGVRGDGSDRDVEFVILGGGEQRFVARISMLPAGGDFGSGRQVLVLLESQTEARRVEQPRSDFIANASHELRTPLASILGYIETLQGHAKDDPAAQSRFLGIMDRQAKRMQRLVDDLMSLSRIEMTEHVRPKESVDVFDLAREVVATLEPIADRYGGRIEVSLPSDRAIVKADRDQLAQVFVNLVENALRYGGESPVVRIAHGADDPRYPDKVGVGVHDNGPGIPKDHIHRLTERFYRVSSTQEREKASTGLGLAIVKHILNRHGGELDIASELGRGSTFAIWLPLERFEVTSASSGAINTVKTDA